MKPWLLDLFCCQGGAANGYQRAGFRVWGVDIAPQPRYVGDVFDRGDAIDLGGHLWHAMSKHGQQGRPTDDMDPLPFEVPTRKAGPMEQAVVKSLQQAVDDGQLRPTDHAMGQLAVEAARAVDLAIMRNDAYAFPQPAAQLRETLIRLRLDPFGRTDLGGPDDPFAKFLAGLDSPTHGGEDWAGGHGANAPDASA